MNIFHLDHNPIRAAMQHVNRVGRAARIPEMTGCRWVNSLMRMREMINIIESNGGTAETWVTQVVQGRTFHFGWQNSKDVLNKRNHKLSLSEGIPALVSPRSKYEVISEGGEERIKLIGPGTSGRMLVVVYEEIEDEDDLIGDTWIRIISVYPPGPAETMRYGGEMMEGKIDAPSDKERENVGGAETMRPHLPDLLKRADERKARAQARKTSQKSKEPSKVR